MSLFNIQILNVHALFAYRLVLDLSFLIILQNHFNLKHIKKG